MTPGAIVVDCKLLISFSNAGPDIPLFSLACFVALAWQFCFCLTEFLLALAINLSLLCRLATLLPEPAACISSLKIRLCHFPGSL